MARDADLPAKVHATKVRLGMVLTKPVGCSLAIPHPYSVVAYDGRAYGADAWARVVCAAGMRDSVAEALQTYESDFGKDAPSDVLRRAQYFLVDEHMRAVGTATAWVTKCADGMLHWLALEPSVRGKGLAKPLVSMVLTRLATVHQRVLLATNTTLPRAIAMYTELGFEPCPLGWLSGDADAAAPKEIEAWRSLGRFGIRTDCSRLSASRPSAA